MTSKLKGFTIKACPKDDKEANALFQRVAEEHGEDLNLRYRIARYGGGHWGRRVHAWKLGGATQSYQKHANPFGVSL